MQFRLLFILSVMGGNIFAQNVGIGTSTPGEKLEVNGNVKANEVKANHVTAPSISVNSNFQLMSGGASGKVLTSDQDGYGNWTNPNTIAGTIYSVQNFGYAINSYIPTINNVWQFCGNPGQAITFTGNQRVVVHATVAVGRNNTGTTGIRLDVGYMQSPSGSVIPMSGSGYLDFAPYFPAAPTRNLYHVSGSFKPAAGSYFIGPVIYSSVANYLNNNDWVSGYYMIINE